MRIIAVLSLALIIVSHAALAAEPAKPVVLQNLEKQGVTLKYLGDDQGVDGWVGFQNGQEQYFYATPDGQAIISGIMMNSKGDIVTLRQIDALRKREPAVDKLAEIPAPGAADTAVANPTPAVAPNPPAKPGKAQQLYAEMEASSWVALGQKTAPVVYTIIDPQCPHCHDMLQDMRKSGALDKGELQLRVIPVGLMSPQSLVQAANLLTVPDPQGALFKHLDGDKKALYADPNANTQKVQGNMVMMQNWKLDVTPVTLYKNKNGEIKILRGRPENLTAVIADLK